jgi:glycosyltransferase involved in cell wall biosynthesis
MKHHSISSLQASVLLPCYNASTTLNEAIGSILTQTFTQWELVAVDDGSTDGSHRLLQEWAARDPRVHFISRPHGGIIEALNAGLAACRADFVARMDADDRSHPDRLLEQVHYLHTHPDIAAVGCLVRGFPADQVRQGFQVYLDWLNALISPDDIARQIYIESPLPHPAMTVRREWLHRLGGYVDHGWPEDYDLWLRMHLSGARFAKVPRVLLDWREHDRRLTRTDRRYAVENFLRAKAHYLSLGPLQGRQALVIWGAGQMGRRLSKHLLRLGAPLKAFVDIDPRKIGRRRRECPIIAPHALPELWKELPHPVLLAAVGSRGARALIREQLQKMGLVEGVDWWAVA